MLLPAAIVGLGCFIYSIATLYSNQPRFVLDRSYDSYVTHDIWNVLKIHVVFSEDVCNDNSPVKMCPLCDYWCDYWELKETCLHSRVTYLFDNPTTVFFAIFMSFWGTYNDSNLNCAKSCWLNFIFDCSCVVS